MKHPPDFPLDMPPDASPLRRRFGLPELEDAGAAHGAAASPVQIAAWRGNGDGNRLSDLSELCLQPGDVGRSDRSEPGPTSCYDLPESCSCMSGPGRRDSVWIILPPSASAGMRTRTTARRLESLIFLKQSASGGRCRPFVQYPRGQGLAKFAGAGRSLVQAATQGPEGPSPLYLPIRSLGRVNSLVT